MSEELHHVQTPFETALQKRTPSVGELSAEETFYAAGWNAGRKKNQAQRRQQEIRGFAVGMVCSLACCAVGMQIWPMAEVPDHSQITESMAPHPGGQTEIAAVEVETTDAGVTSSEIGGLDEVFAMLSPASWFAVEQGPRRSDTSVLARAGSDGIDVESLWNMASVAQGQMRIPSTAAPDRQDAESPESLRAFPLSADALEEWL